MGIEYPETLQRLIGYYSKLPGIGRRSAERLALGSLTWSEQELSGFGEVLRTLKQRVHPCAECGNYAEGELCPICQSASRQRDVVCVVEQASQIMVIEQSGSFHGLYHVLGGKLSPLSGKGPDDLRVRELRERIARGGIRELILATSPDVEGEATASYLAHEFADSGVVLSRIAAGVPVGSDLSYADAATLSIAINSRRAMP